MIKTIFLVVVLSSVLGVPDADRVDNAEANRITKVNYQGEYYSGYLEVNAGKAQFHYMFYFADDQPYEKPVVLWLNGGPGCSSLQGAVNENGPFVFKAGTAEFQLNDYSWTKFANMLYIESPVGVGFSYGDKLDQTDETTAKFNLEALVQFFIKFPEFQDRRFYISGESYAGIYIPTLAKAILEYNAKPDVRVPKILLTGLAIGNGCTDPTECTEEADPFPIHVLKFFGQHKFFSPDLFEQILALQSECYGKDTQPCKDLVLKSNQQMSENGNYKFNPYNVYGPCYTYTPPGEKAGTYRLGKSLFSVKGDDVPPCADVVGLYTFFRNPEFMRALHVKEDINFRICADEAQFTYKSNPKGSYYIYQELLQNRVKILHFSGDVDAVVPITGTLYWIDKLQRELNLATIKPWRAWFMPPDEARKQFDSLQNAGSIWELDGLTFLTVRNAGHMVVMEKRAEGVEFMKAFIEDRDL